MDKGGAMTLEQWVERARVILHSHGDAKHITPTAFEDLKATTIGVIAGQHALNSDQTAYMDLVLAFMVAAWEMGYRAHQFETMYGEMRTSASHS
jgi:hypothetical protein